MKKRLLFVLLSLGISCPALVSAQDEPISTQLSPVELPKIIAEPSSVVFPALPIGASLTKTVTITNVAGHQLFIRELAQTPSQDISIVSDSCTSLDPLPDQQTCAFDVLYTAVSKGVHTAFIVPSDTFNALGIIPVNGRTVAPEVFLTTNLHDALTSIDFMGETVGKTSVEHEVSLISVGTSALHISDITADSAFAVTDDCPAIMDPFGSTSVCTLKVSFSPTAAQTFDGTLTITDDASDSPQTISLTGFGVGSGEPHASLSRHAVGFRHQLVNTTSAAEEVTLKNTGTVALTITSITASGDFMVTDDCGAGLAPDASCTLMISFEPTATGEATGSVTITDDAPNSHDMISLTGTGTEHDGPKAELSTTSIDFGEVEDNTTSDPQSMMISNLGDEDLVITGIEIEGDDALVFHSLINCLRTLAPGQSCSGEINFTPSLTQTTYTATLTFTDNSSDSPQTITLTGTGVPSSNTTGGGCSLIR